MIDRLGIYQEAGIDELFLSSGVGQTQEESLGAIQRFAEEVMPQFTGREGAGLLSARPMSEGAV